MILLTIIVILLTFGLLFLGYKVINLEKELNTPKENTTSEIVLAELKNMPTIEDIDPESKLLQDIIESSKLEGWKAEIKEDASSYYRRAWNFIIYNPQKTIFIHTILRVYEKDYSGEKVQIGYFSVQDPLNQGMSFDVAQNKIQKYLITQYLWDFLLKENEERYKENWEYYVNQKKVIEGYLTTLSRDRQLKKLFENNLEDKK